MRLTEPSPLFIRYGRTRLHDTQFPNLREILRERLLALKLLAQDVFEANSAKPSTAQKLSVSTIACFEVA